MQRHESASGPSRPIATLQFFGRYWGVADIGMRWSPEGSVVNDPTVWTGRVLQVGSDNLEMIGLALLYPALEWSVDAPGHHGYPHASDLILRKALRGRLGHQITGATARPFLHLLNPTRRPRQSVKRYRLLKKALDLMLHLL
jgi:hypothetical protein